MYPYFVEFDEECGFWCVFDNDFALVSFSDEKEANDYCSSLNKNVQSLNRDYPPPDVSEEKVKTLIESKFKKDKKDKV